MPAAIGRRAAALAKTYRLALLQDEDGYVCRVVEFPALIARGSSPDQCEREGRVALTALIASFLIDKDEPPPPRHLKVRRTQINFRLSETDYDLIEAAAERAGDTVAGYVRRQALAAAQSPED